MAIEELELYEPTHESQRVSCEMFDRPFPHLMPRYSLMILLSTPHLSSASIGPGS